MHPPAARPTRSSLGRALLLLVPLALLGTALLGLLAHSANADHLPDKPVVSDGPTDYTKSPTPSWTVGVPAGHTLGCTLTGPAATTVPVTCPTAGGVVTPIDPLSTQGSYTLAVTSTRPDAQEPVSPDSPTVTVLHPGGTSPAETRTFVLDTTAPTAVTATHPAGDRYLGWTVSSTDATAVTYMCTVTGPDSITMAGFTCNTQPVKPTLTAGDGAYTLTVTATDAAGNSTAPVTSQPFNYDGTSPSVDFTGTQPVGPSRALNPNWTYEASGGAAPTCTLTGPSGTQTVTCSPTGYTASLPDSPSSTGSWVLRVTSMDAAGNSTTVTSNPYVLDRTPPTVSITPGSTTGTADLVEWTVSIGEGRTGTCTLTGGTSTTCVDGTTISAALPVDGSVTLTVTATDSLGNPATAQSSYTRSTTPTAPSVSVPEPRAATNPQTWSFTVDDRTTSVACRLERAGAVDPIVQNSCTTFTGTAGTFTYLLPSDGTYTLYVTASNSTSSLTSTGSAEYTLDATEPAGPALSRTPSATTGSAATLSWSWTPGMTECLLTIGGVQQDDWVSCHSGTFTTSTDPVKQGAYTLQVRYYDDLDNRGPLSSSSYLFDSLAPGAPGVALVGDSTRMPGSVRWDLTLTGDGVRFQCRLITASDADPAWVACTSPHTQTLAEGAYELQVRQVDAAGNASSATSSTVNVDGSAPPAPTVTGGPTTSTERTLTWSLAHASLDGKTFVCRLLRNGSGPDAATACSSNYSVTVTQDGAYVLEVASVDAAGNVGTFSPSAARTVDTAGPAAPAVTLALTRGNTKSATWTVTPSEAGTTSHCRLERTAAGAGTVSYSAWGPCTSYTFPLLSGDGVYVLEVRNYDALLNEGAVGRGPGYTLDATPPLVPTVTGSRDGTTHSVLTASYAFAGEGTATCRLYRTGTADALQTVTGCLTGHMFTFPSVSGSYYVEVTYTDSFANTSEPGRSGTYALDVTPPVSPSVTGSLDGKTDNVLELRYAFSGEGTATCRLYRAGSTTPVETTTGCTATGQGFAISLPPTDGTYRLEVTYTDAYGNVSDPGVSGPYVLDVTKPGTATVTVIPRTDNVKSATWAIVLPEAGATAECQLRYLAGAGSTVQAWHACTTGTYALLAGDGLYVLDVRVTDAVGNVGDVRTGETYLLDTDPPAAPTVTRTGDPKDNVLTFTIGFDKALTDTAACQLRTLSGTAVGDAFSCTSGQVVSVPNMSGTYVLHVALTDAVGNTGPEGKAPAYELDVTAPAAPAVASDRVGTDNEKVATFTFTVEGTATCQLLYKGSPVGDAVPCTSPWVVTLSSGDGDYQLVVTDTDTVGNTSPPFTTPAYVLDLTAPQAPSVTGPASPGNSRTVSWTYSGEGTATCTLLLDGSPSGVGVACGATGATATLTRDGSWTLRVTFTDAVGNTGLPGTSSAYVLDTVLPVAPTVSGPVGPAQGRTPAWTVVTESGTSTQCRLVRGGTVVSGWGDCTGGFTAALDGLPDGAYVLESRATDAAQNVGPVGASAPYVLDTTAPLAVVVSGPSGPSQLRTPGFTWSGEAGARAECQLSRDGTVVGGWVACSSGYAPVLDRDGTWTVTVRLTDAAGNVSETAVSGGYLLDTTAPATPVVTPPKTPGRDLAPSWGAVVEGGTSLECRLTGADGVVADWAACTLPLTTSLTGRPDGAYVLEVRATDAAGNVSPVGTGTYVLDTVAPAAAVVTSPVGPGRTRTPSFTFTTETGATTRCRLTSGSTLISDFAPCTSPAALNLADLPDGTYTLTVRVTDAAGNPGPAATGTYVLDTTAPAAPVLMLAPASPSPARSVTWAFTYEPGSTLVCRLTFPTGAVREISGCTSPLTVDLAGLPDGSYTLTVRAVDAAGNLGAVLTDVHVIDSAALAPPTVTGPATPASTRTPRWTITGTGTECRLSRGTTVLRDWAACSGSFTADLFGQPDGSYVLSVRSKDAAGAVSASVQSHYVLDTTAPGAATVVAPPTPSTNRMPTWTIASGELGATAECRVLVFGSVLLDWRSCGVSLAGTPYALDLTGAGDGTYTLVVRLTDAAGNRSTVEASSPYVLDTSAPVAVGITGPPSPGKDLRPVWLLSSGSGAVLECRLTSAAGVVSDWAPCTTEFRAELTGLPDGIYTLAVRALSAAGTPGPETTSAYELNTSAPGAPTALALAGGLKPTGNNRSPSWTFTLPSGTTGHCRVVQGTRVLFDGPCSSPFRLDLSGAVDGSYTLTVRAVSPAGTAGPAATSTYVLDTEATAAPVFTQVPGTTGSTLDPQWRFSVARGATAQCRLLYGGTPLDDWTACTSPFTAQLTGRPDGRYVLQVRAVDAAGNASAPVSNQYDLDRTAAPVPTFTTTPPATGSDRTVRWSFTGPEGTRLECRVVGPDGSATAWGDCGAPAAALRLSGQALLAGGSYVLDLAGRGDGLYTLEVRTVEADGRRGAAASTGYRLDTRLPDMPSFSDVPTATGSDPKPVWLWDLASDELVECRLVRVGGGALTDWQECGESQFVADLTRLGDGAYALELRVTDAAGNVSPVRSAAYRFDTTAPAQAVFTSRPPAGGSDRTVSWTFGPVDGRATCSITRDRTLVREGACSGRYDLDLGGLPDGVYTLTVRVTDAAGNTSGATVGTYALRTVGLRGPVRVDPPPVRPTEPPAPGDGPPTGPGRGGTGVVGPAPSQGSGPGTGVPTQSAEDDVVRASEVRPAPAAPGGTTGKAAPAEPAPKPSGSNPLLPRALPVEDVPDVLRELVTGTATKPTLPLALLAIVILFLLAQNRIDRRDPKLAAAPVEAEPELDFTAFVRRPGSATS